MANRRFDPIQEMTSSGRVLFGNLLVAAPYIISYLVPILIVFAFGGSGLIGAIMSPAMLRSPAAISDLFSPAFFVGIGLAVIAGIVLSISATGAVYGASANALAGRLVDFASLLAMGRKHAGNVLGYSLILFLFALVAEFVIFLLAMISHGILGVVGNVLAVICASFLLVYGLPALVVGEMSPGDAILESIDLARANFGSTLVLILAGIVVAIGAYTVALIVSFIPILGQLIGLAVQGLGSAFFALISVRFFTLLSGRATPTGLVCAPTAP